MAQASRSATQHGRYAQANGLMMFYEARGSGPPLILLHGGTATSSMWRPQIPTSCAALQGHYAGLSRPWQDRQPNR